MERLYEIRDELKQLDFHSYNSLGVVEQYFRCRLWVDLSRACLVFHYTLATFEALR